MTADTLCDAMRSGLSSLFGCEPHGDYLRVSTPFLYPDGDVIDVFVRARGEEVAVTDLGETTRWLRGQTLSPRRSPKQSALMQDACVAAGVELYRGMLVARSRAPEQLAEVVVRVAQAALRVSDLSFTFRTRTVETVTEEVADFLAEQELPFTRGQPLAGRSGRSWKPDFHVRAPRQSSLTFVLSSGSRAAARTVTQYVSTACFDLNQLKVGPEALQFVSLFDDTADVWVEEDFKLLESLSTVALWSQRDDLLEKLRAA